MIARPPRPRWSVTILTVPEREPLLLRLLASLTEVGADPATEVVVVYNGHPSEPREAIAGRLGAACPPLGVRIRFNEGRLTVAEGRNLQLSSCRAPLVCFLDDDVTLHGEVFPGLERALRDQPVALLGVPSFDGNSGEPFEFRAAMPWVDAGGLRYAQLQGRLCAGYRQLLVDVGGFSSLRGFWGEWSELTLRLWRRGYPTAYRLSAGYLRHWRQEPHSAAHKSDRARHVLWGLACTVLEYDAIASPASGAFWERIERSYLSDAAELGTAPEVFRTMLELAPRFVECWPAIRMARARAAGDPFPFGPFHPVTAAEVAQIRSHAARALLPLKRTTFPPLRAGASAFSPSALRQPVSRACT
jgi:hypothetical protein